MKQQLNELIDNFAKDFKAIVNQDEQPKLEKGKWYKSASNSKIKLFIIDYKDYGNIKAVGFNNFEEWDCDLSKYHWGLSKPVPMTEQEILDMAKNYLENTLGFTEGCKFKSAHTGGEYIYKTPLEIDKIGTISSNMVGVLFNPDTHKWAELIKDEDIYVGEHKVIFSNEGIYINGCWINKAALKQLLPLNPIFKQILDRLEK